MASELQIAQGIQAVIQGTSSFANADVVLNDWDVLDGDISAGPWFIIETAQDWESTQRTTAEQNRWTILGHQVHQWGGRTLKTTLDEVRTTRQDILDTFNAVGNARSAGGLEAVDILTIRSAGPPTYMYHAYIPAEQREEAVPEFIVYPWAFEVRLNY